MPSPVLNVPLPTAIAPLTVNKEPNKLAPTVPINNPRNPGFCYFASFLIVSVTLFINKPDSSSDLTIFIIFIFSFEIISVVICEAKFKGCEAKSEEGRPDTKIFLWIAASVVNAAAVILIVSTHF